MKWDIKINMKKTALLTIGLVGIIIVLAVVQVTVTNKISTHGIYLSKLEQELDSLKKENTLLKEEILEKSSLTNISEKAETLGFVASRTEMHLSTPLPLARR